MPRTRKNGTSVHRDDFTQVRPTEDELAAFLKRYGRQPSVPRAAHTCGARIWYSGIGIGSHVRHCKGASGVATASKIKDRYDNWHVVPGPWTSIFTVIKANKDAGSHWFDEETLSFFDGVVYHEIFAGRLFITGEKHPGIGRRWTVRVADDNGIISTYGEFGAHSTLASARLQASSVLRLVGVES